MIRVVCPLCILIAVLATAGLVFGLHDLPGKLALALLIWCSVSVPVSLLTGEVIRRGQS